MPNSEKSVQRNVGPGRVHEKPKNFKKSIIKLLEKNGYKDIKIYDSKFVKGKMIVIASKV